MEGKGSSDQRTFFFLPEQIYKSRAAHKKRKKKKEKKKLRDIEQGKAAVAQSSTKCTTKDPEWQIGPFSALSSAALGPNDCFALFQWGRAAMAAFCHHGASWLWP